MPRMAPTVSALAKETMRIAFEDLMRTINPADEEEMQSVTAIDQVREAALTIETQLAARQALRNMRRLAPFLHGLEHYSKAIDILCNGTPFLAWIWSPISLILRVASEYTEAFEHIIKGYSRIAKSLGRFEILGNAFPTNADFQQTLAVIYADVLQFHKHAYKFVRRSGWHLLFNTSWGSFQRRFNNIIQDLDQHGDLIDREANAHNIAEARQWRKDSLLKVEQDEEHQATKQYQSVLSSLKIDETEQIAIFESICEEGSEFAVKCDWMTRNKQISAWLQRKPETRQLWIQGNPGTGKSVISKQLVTYIQASKSQVLHHFCSYTYASSMRYDAILKSLLHQLLRASGELSAYVYQEYVVSKKVPTTTSLEQIFETLLASLSLSRQPEYIWLIIDGIEECEKAKQTRLISFLFNIASKHDTRGSTYCKVLLSSRALPTRIKRLPMKQIVSLGDEMEHVSKAIRLYASHRLLPLHERLRQLDLGAEEVESIVTQKAAGMFLYARLLLDYLSNNIFLSGGELKESIEKLPATVAEFYQKILTHMLARLDPRSTERIKCILSWIAFAKRPLRKLELLSALAFSSGSPDVANPAPQYVLDLCSPLIEEKQDTALAFIHISVKEFLQSCSIAVAIDERVALHDHGLAAVACLLSAVEVFHESYSENSRLLRLVKGTHGLHVYATEYWTEYLLADAAIAHSLGGSSSLLDLSYRLAAALATMSTSMAMLSNSLDDRLNLLAEHPTVQSQVAQSLLARSQKRLESEILNQLNGEISAPSTKADSKDGVSIMLDAYQKAVETLLDQDSCPGASSEELRLFKSQFRTSAYTCRLRSCPRATIGFGSEQLRREHEIGHAGGFRCSTPGCHYPPFSTPQNLKSHSKNHHTPPVVRKTIRKVGRLSTQSRPSGNTRADALPSTYLNTINGSPALDNAIEEEGSSTIKCICGFADYDGSTVLCEKCDTWQHIVCYYESVSHVPDVHLCADCLPRPFDKKSAADKQSSRREASDPGRKKLSLSNQISGRANPAQQTSRPHVTPPPFTLHGSNQNNPQPINFDHVFPGHIGISSPTVPAGHLQLPNPDVRRTPPPLLPFSHVAMNEHRGISHLSPDFIPATVPRDEWYTVYGPYDQALLGPTGQRPPQLLNSSQIADFSHTALSTDSTFSFRSLEEIYNSLPASGINIKDLVGMFRSLIMTVGIRKFIGMVLLVSTCDMSSVFRFFVPLLKTPTLAEIRVEEKHRSKNPWKQLALISEVESVYDSLLNSYPQSQDHSPSRQQSENGEALPTPRVNDYTRTRYFRSLHPLLHPLKNVSMLQAVLDVPDVLNIPSLETILDSITPGTGVSYIIQKFLHRLGGSTKTVLKVVSVVAIWDSSTEFLYPKRPSDAYVASWMIGRTEGRNLLSSRQQQYLSQFPSDEGWKEAEATYQDLLKWCFEHEWLTPDEFSDQ